MQRYWGEWEFRAAGQAVGLWESDIAPMAARRQSNKFIEECSSASRSIEMRGF